MNCVDREMVSDEIHSTVFLHVELACLQVSLLRRHIIAAKDAY